MMLQKERVVKHWSDKVWEVGILWVLLLAFGWGQRLEMNVQPLFGTLSAEQGVMPLLITLENRGDSVKGVIAVELGDFNRIRRYLYPLELPAGARKEVVAYPSIDAYAYRLVVRFETPRTLAMVEVPVNQQGNNSRLVAAVTDEIGGLGFLRNVKLKAPQILDPRGSWRSSGGGNETVSYQAVFCRPDRFPVRAGACNGLNAILIGPGAERLTEAQWRALRLWVSTGGTLIVPGGSGAVYLQSPLLQSMLPVQNPRTTQVDNLAAVGSLTSQSPPAGSAIITQTSLKPGTRVWLKQGEIPLIASRSHGLGMVFFLAFNPWDQPLRSSRTNAELWKTFLAATPVITPALLQSRILDAQAGAMNDDPWNSGGFGAGSNSFKNESFRVPAAGTVLGILLLYFILVVPVNFLILKRFRALDWTWLTAPAIALLFVFLLYRVGSGLYKQGQVSDTKASILLAAGTPEAYIYASTLFFFPRAGNYNMRFEHADSVESGIQRDYGSVQGSPQLSTIEGSPILVEDYRVRNLSFQWFRYTRFIELPAVIDGSLKATRTAGGVHVEGTIINRLPYPLKSATLLTPDGGRKIEDFEPGQTRKVQIFVQNLQLMNDRTGMNNEFYRDPLDPILQYGVKTRNWRDARFIILKANAEEPNVTPALDVSGSIKQDVTYYCVLPVQMEGD
jgi:hypothetical protein